MLLQCMHAASTILAIAAAAAAAAAPPQPCNHMSYACVPPYAYVCKQPQASIPATAVAAPQACNRMSYECVPLYDTLGENAVEFIINHSEAVITIVDGRKLGSLAGAIKGINTAQFKHVVYWGAEDAAAVQVRVHVQATFPCNSRRLLIR
jgi:hypothetical protein